MPIYEYKCDLCNCLWEEIQNFSDPVLTICKGCEEEGGVHKLFSGQIAFHLKGTGWYKDGYSSAPPPITSETPQAVKDSPIEPFKDKPVAEPTVEGMEQTMGIHRDDAKLVENKAKVEDYFGEKGVPVEEDGVKITDPEWMGTAPMDEKWKKEGMQRVDEMMEQDKKDGFLELQVEDSIRRDEIRFKIRDKTGSDEEGIKAALKYKDRNTKYVKEIEAYQKGDNAPEKMRTGPLPPDQEEKKKIDIVKK